MTRGSERRLVELRNGYGTEGNRRQAAEENGKSGLGAGRDLDARRVSVIGLRHARRNAAHRVFAELSKSFACGP